MPDISAWKQSRELFAMIIWATAILLATNIATAGLVIWIARDNLYALQGVRVEQAICAARLEGIAERNKISDVRQVNIERMLLKNCDGLGK